MGSIGNSIGSAVSGFIWKSTFLPQLERNLPKSALSNIAEIYEELPSQLACPIGSHMRDAIAQAYEYAQVRIPAAGTAIMVLSVIWVGIMGNIDVRKMTQTRGNDFFYKITSGFYVGAYHAY